MSSELEYGDQLLGMRAKLTTYIKSAAVPIRVEVADKMHGPSSVIGLEGGWNRGTLQLGLLPCQQPSIFAKHRLRDVNLQTRPCPDFSPSIYTDLHHKQHRQTPSPLYLSAACSHPFTNFNRFASSICLFACFSFQLYGSLLSILFLYSLTARLSSPEHITRCRQIAAPSMKSLKRLVSLMPSFLPSHLRHGLLCDSPKNCHSTFTFLAVFATLTTL